MLLNDDYVVLHDSYVPWDAVLIIKIPKDGSRSTKLLVIWSMIRDHNGIVLKAFSEPAGKGLTSWGRDFNSFGGLVASQGFDFVLFMGERCFCCDRLGVLVRKISLKVKMVASPILCC